MDRIRSSAREAGVHDPLSQVVADLGVSRPMARRLLAAYDVISADLGRLRVVASLGSVESWRLLSETDPRWAARIKDQVFTGGMPLSAVKDALETARRALAVPADVASMSLDDVVASVQRALAVDFPLKDPMGIADEAGFDLEYRLVDQNEDEELPLFNPHCALLISPTLLFSRSYGASASQFKLRIMAAVSMYPLVAVACTSAVERSGLVRDLADCRWRPGVPAFVTLRRASIRDA